MDVELRLGGPIYNTILRGRAAGKAVVDHSVFAVVADLGFARAFAFGALGGHQ